LCFFFKILFSTRVNKRKKKKKKHKKIHLHSRWALEWITRKRERPLSNFLPCEKTQSNWMFCAFFLSFCRSVQLGHKKECPKGYHPSSDSVSFGSAHPHH
jgi:hypothetical protein